MPGAADSDIFIMEVELVVNRSCSLICGRPAMQQGPAIRIIPFYWLLISITNSCWYSINNFFVACSKSQDCRSHRTKLLESHNHIVMISCKDVCRVGSNDGSPCSEKEQFMMIKVRKRCDSQQVKGWKRAVDLWMLTNGRYFGKGWSNLMSIAVLLSSTHHRMGISIRSAKEEKGGVTRIGALLLIAKTCMFLFWMTELSRRAVGSVDNSFCPWMRLPQSSCSSI